MTLLPLLSIPLVKLLYFHFIPTIKGIQISPSSLLFLHCFVKSLFSYCRLILYITHSICSLYQWPQILTTFRKHLHYFVPSNCLGGIFPQDASISTFPFYNSYSLHLLFTAAIFWFKISIVCG